MTCPLCQDSNFRKFSQDKFRSYQECLKCGLIFVPRSELISSSEELDRYEAHENSENDPAYEKYLSSIADDLMIHIYPHERGLDFGSGKTKLLEHILDKRNFNVSSYDLFFHQDQELLNQKYDFIIMSEVIEHLRDPKQVLQILKSLLNDKGRLFVKTKLAPRNKENFDEWFYKRDKTHIQFFSPRAFEVMKKNFSFTGGEEIGKDLFIFRND